MNPKNFYSTYQADPTISPLGMDMLNNIIKSEAKTALEFGCGEAKHLRHLRSNGLDTIGIDLSILNVIRAQSQMDNIMLGNERVLPFFANVDVVFTVSVLDHIEQIDEIITQLKRIAKKGVYLMETNDIPAPYYYPHNYESYGFNKILKPWLSSEGDGSTYHVWYWRKLAGETANSFDHV